MSRKTKTETSHTNLKNSDGKAMIIIPSLGDYPSRKEWESACWGKIVKSKELLQLLTTSHERHNLVLRAVATSGLVSGKSYREIGRETWLSSQTISGIKKALNGRMYRSYSERSKKGRGVKKFTASIFPATQRPRGRPQRTKYGTLYMP